MTKKMLLFAAMATVIIMVAAAFVVSPDTDADTIKVNIDGYTYELDETELTACLTNTSSLSGDVVIPETVVYGENTYTVVTMTAMSSNSSITSLTLPDTVTSIPNRAVYSCSKLTSFTAKGITAIPEYGIANNSSLVNVVLGDITSIGSYGFYQNQKVTDLEINGAVSYIGDRAFYLDRLVNLTIHIADEVVIADYAFASNYYMEKLALVGGTVTSVGANGFYYCEVLEDLDAVFDLDIINTYAFGRCYELTDLTFLGEVTEIGNYAFWEDKGLQSITIPGAILNVGNYAFQNCSSITAWNVDFSGAEIVGQCAFSGSSYTDFVLVNGGKTVAFIPNDKAMEIPETVTEISDYAAYNSTFASVVIPEKVTYVGAYAFYGNTALSEVVFAGDAVNTFGNYAFEGCTALTAIDLPASTATIGTYAFEKTRITSIVFPAAVVSVGNYAFANNSALVSVILPASTATFGNSVFSSDSALTTVVIPEGAKIAFGNSVFSNDSKLTDLVVDGAITSTGSSWLSGTAITDVVVASDGTEGSKVIWFAPTTLTEYTIGADITAIGAYAFYNCSKLVLTLDDDFAPKAIPDYAFYGCSLIDIAIPASVETIGMYAFYNCKALTSIVLPENVVSVGNYAFNGCSGVTEIVLNDGLTTLGNYVFYNCTSAVSVNLPASLETVGNNLFYGCSKLVDIVFEKGYTKFGDYMFRNCTSIESMVVPEGVTELRYTFYGCSKLASIELPESLTTLYQTFYNCTSLVEVTIPEAVSSIGYASFYGCSKLTTVNMPETPITFLPSGVNSNTFYNCRALKEIDISHVYNLGAYTFQNCVALTHVDLCPDITALGNYLFAGCTGLTEIAIPEKVTSIGQYTFSGCSNLSDVVIPGGVTTIGTYAFQNCTALTFIAIPEKVDTVGSNTFKGCTALTTVEFDTAYCNVQNSSFVGCTKLSEIVINGYLLLQTSAIPVTALKSVYVYNEVPISNGANAVTMFGSFVKTDADGTKYIEINPCYDDNGDMVGCNKLILASSAETLVIDGDVTAIAKDVLTRYVNAGALDLSETEIFFEKDNGIYCGKTLVAVKDVEGTFVVADGTQSISAEAFKGINNIDTIVLPWSVEQLAYNAIAPASGLQAVYFNSNPAIANNGYLTIAGQSTYVLAGVNGLSVKVDAYYADVDGNTVYITLNDDEHTDITGVDVAENTLYFDIEVDAGYDRSDIVVIADGKVVEGSGNYAIPVGTDDVYVEVTGVTVNRYVITLDAPQGTIVKYSNAAPVDSTVLTFSVDIAVGYAKTKDYAVFVNGEAVAPVAYIGTLELFEYFVTDDLVIEVTGIVSLGTVDVTFVDSINGISTVTVDIGTTVDLFVPTAVGNTFGGWYVDRAFTEPFDFDSLVVEDIALYAKWFFNKDAKVDVTFSAEMGTVVALLNGYQDFTGGSVFKGSVIELTYVPDNKGVCVDGWTINGTTVKSFDKTITVVADMDLEIVCENVFINLATYDYITDQQTPYGDDYLVLWKATGLNLYGMAGYAIVDNFIFVKKDADLLKIDLETGEIVAKVDTGSTGVSYPVPGFGQVLDPISGNVYTMDLVPIFKLDKTDNAAYYSQGMYIVETIGNTAYAYSAVDADPEVPNNVQTSVWSKKIGYYMDTATSGPTIMFGDGFFLMAGVLPSNQSAGDRFFYSYDLFTGELIDSVVLDKLYACYWHNSMLYYGEGYLTATAYRDGLFGAVTEGDYFDFAWIKVNDDGTFDHTTLVQTGYIGNSYNSAVIVVDGLGYVLATNRFLVLDMDTGAVLASTEKDTSLQKMHKNMIVSTGYDGKVMGYVIPYSNGYSTIGFVYDVATNEITEFKWEGIIAKQNGEHQVGFGPNGQLVIANDSKELAVIVPAKTVTVHYADGSVVTEKVRLGYAFVGDADYTYFYDAEKTLAYDNAPVVDNLDLYAFLPSGVFGDVEWSFVKSTGTLTITGEGQIESQSSAAKYPWYAFKNHVNTIIVDDGVTYIGARAFDGFKHATEVIVGNDVTAISKYAFRNVPLECIAFGSSLEIVSTIAFGDNVFEYSNGMAVDVKEFAGKTFTNVDGILVTTVANGTVDGLVWDLDLVDGQLTIDGDGDLASQTKASKFPYYKFRNDIRTVVIGDGVTYIGTYAFDKYTNLETVLIGDGVTAISKNAFRNCTGIDYIAFGDSVEKISTIAFSGLNLVYANGKAVAVTDFAGKEFFNVEGDLVTYYADGTVGDLVWSMDLYTGTLTIEGDGEIPSETAASKFPYYAFKDSVVNLVIGDGVTYIGKHAFNGYETIETVTIGNAVTGITKYAFKNCTAIEKIVFGSSVASVSTIAFTGLTFVDENGEVITGSAAQRAAKLCGKEFDGHNTVLFSAGANELYYIYLDGMGDINGWYSAYGPNAGNALTNALLAKGIDCDISVSGWISSINGLKGTYDSETMTGTGFSVYIYGSTSVTVPSIYFFVTGDVIKNSVSNIVYVSFGAYSFDENFNAVYKVKPTENTKNLLTGGPFAGEYTPLPAPETYYIYLDGMGDISGWYSATGSNAVEALKTALDAKEIDYDLTYTGFINSIGDFEGGIMDSDYEGGYDFGVYFYGSTNVKSYYSGYFLLGDVLKNVPGNIVYIPYGHYTIDWMTYDFMYELNPSTTNANLVAGGPFLA
ncbi:MAG: leucine-rich repeat protein [archaeon]|nr:leucine-rich repeat protein [archaeon]